MAMREVRTSPDAATKAIITSRRSGQGRATSKAEGRSSWNTA